MQNFNVVLMVIFILLYMLLFSHNLHFIFEKLAIKIKIDTYNFLLGIGMQPPSIGLYSKL